MVALTLDRHEGRDIVAVPPVQNSPPSRSLVFILVSALGWSVGSIAAAAIAGFLVGFAGTVTGVLPTIPEADKEVLFRCVGVIGSASLLLCVALASARGAGAGRIRAGLGGLRIARPILTAAITLAMVAYGVGLTLLIYEPNPPLLASMMTLDHWVVALLIVALVIAAPLGEELFFRGWLWRGVRTHWGTLATAATTTAVWLALHAPEGLVLVVLLLPLALALPLARRFGGSVSASLAVHVAYNATVVLAPYALLWAGVLSLPH